MLLTKTPHDVFGFQLLETIRIASSHLTSLDCISRRLWVAIIERMGILLCVRIKQIQ